jgi:hypothetical protein
MEMKMSIEPAIDDYVLIEQKKTKGGTWVSRVVEVFDDGEIIKVERGRLYSTVTGFPPGTDPKPWKAHLVRPATEADFERYATPAQKQWRKAQAGWVCETVGPEPSPEPSVDPAKEERSSYRKFFEGIKAGDSFAVAGDGRAYSVTVESVGSDYFTDTSGHGWSLSTGYGFGTGYGPRILRKEKPADFTAGSGAAGDSPKGKAPKLSALSCLLENLGNLKVEDSIRLKNGELQKVIKVVIDPVTGKVTNFTTLNATNVHITYRVQTGVDDWISGVLKTHPNPQDAQEPSTGVLDAGHYARIFARVRLGDVFEVRDGLRRWDIKINKVEGNILWDTNGTAWNRGNGFSLAGSGAQIERFVKAGDGPYIESTLTRTITLGLREYLGSRAIVGNHFIVVEGEQGTLALELVESYEALLQRAVAAMIGFKPRDARPSDLALLCAVMERINRNG